MPDIRIEDINAGVLSSPASFILDTEKKYAERLRTLAERVTSSENLSIVLISGPSGSGKTTTANLLADVIIEQGRRCMVLSLDDFYLPTDSPRYPRHKDGTLDYETVYALDLPQISETLSDIANNREFSVPKYNFKKSRRDSMREYPPIDGGVVIIEGLHALNPLISTSLSYGSAFKIFISVSTNVTMDGERIISGRKIRFLRRLIRDSLYRATSPLSTVKIWRSVLLGEDNYLYPTRKYADVEFDTFHAFELSIMRPFAEALITEDIYDSDEIVRVAYDAVRRAEPLPLECLPRTSLIREFVPGGIYEQLY